MSKKIMGRTMLVAASKTEASLYKKRYPGLLDDAIVVLPQDHSHIQGRYISRVFVAYGCDRWSHDGMVETLASISRMFRSETHHVDPYFIMLRLEGL